MQDIPGESLPGSVKNQLEDGVKSMPASQATERKMAEGAPMVSLPQGSKGQIVGKGLAALDFVSLGLQQYMSWAWKYDKDQIDEHSKVAKSVQIDMNKALNSGLIPDKYQNKQDIGNIMNVILQGVNNTSDSEIYNIGMKIYNTISKPDNTEITPIKPIPARSDNTRVIKTIAIPQN